MVFFLSSFSVYVKWPIDLMKIDGARYYKIGELANLLELSPRTIRYYEEIGLLNSVKRIEGGKRVYTDRDLQRLKFIQRLKHLGLTLSEMHELEDIYQIHRTNKKVLARLLELLDDNTMKIDERVNSLLRLKTDILSYEEKIREKLNFEEETPKGGELDKSSGDYQRSPDTYR
ncbi:MAG: MerR family transcriptional regulator [Deltaproteobacteria bacterium]|nr:MerR family transcriptional regulator [Deltaproteobacteria bacterium]